MTPNGAGPRHRREASNRLVARQAWAEDDDDQFDGPVEVDETYFGGERRNMSIKKRKAM